MIFRPFYYFDTGCAAYVVGCGGKGLCAVVDPQERDLNSYITFAESKGMRITHVVDTHIHADHRSARRLLAEAEDAKYCLHHSADVNFAFTPLNDGEFIELGNVSMQVLHTPGHTSEAICLVVIDHTRGSDPWFVLTGDTLFVGAVGRPDLPGDTEVSAAQLYESLHQRLLTLPENLEFYPAHFSGSVCGAGMSGKPMSTLAFEKRFNPTISLSKEEFISKISSGILAKPAEMEEILLYNRGAKYP